MVSRAVKTKTCDRCPLGKKPVPATRTIRFGFADTFWDIDVCEMHGSMLEREMYAWGRLGRIVEDNASGTMFGSDYGTNMKRLGELRATQSREDRELAEAKRADHPAATGAELLAAAQGPQPAAPADAGEYVFTEHALQRLEEREIRAIDALWAASEPTLRRPARQQGLMIHERAGTKVVLNTQTKAIITVAVVDTNRKAVAL